MRIKKIEKIWKGNKISLRDYDAKKFAQEGGVVIDINGDRMTLSPDKLLNGYASHNKPIKSKYNGEAYLLWDYSWKPDDVKEKDPNFCYCTPASPRPLNFEKSLDPKKLIAYCARCKKVHLKEEVF